MKSTRDLIDKIKKNAPEVIEIDEKIACSTEIVDGLGINGNKISLAGHIGDNKIITFMDDGYPKKDVFVLDLISKKVISKNKVDFHGGSGTYSFRDTVVLDDKNYIAIADGIGRVLILDISKMKIVSSNSIISRDSIHVLHKHGGKLYGLTGSWPHCIFFVSPATSTPEFKQVGLGNDILRGDVALDSSGNVFFSYGKKSRIGGSDPRSIPGSISAYYGPLYMGNEMCLIETPSESYFISMSNDRNCAHVFKGKGKTGIEWMLTDFIQIPSEIIKKIEVISENSKIILIMTDKASYLYDLPKGKILGKFEATLSYGCVRGIEEGRLLCNSIFYPDSLLNVSIKTLCEMKDNGDVSLVLDALKENKSVLQVVISKENLDASNIKSLHHLRKARPELKFNLSDNVKSMLDLIKKSEEEKDQLDSIKSIQTSQEGMIKELKQNSLERDEKEKQLNLKLSSAEEKTEQLKKQMIEQKESAQQNQEMMEKKVVDQIKTLSDLKQDFLQREQQDQTKIDECGQEIKRLHVEKSELTKEYNEVLLLLSIPQTEPRPIGDQLDEAKASLSQELLMQLVEPTQTIRGLYLIRWSEQDELQNIKEDLAERGAILNVDHLLACIKSIKPPYSEQGKISELIKKLMMDYEEGVLPDSAKKTLKQCIIPNMRKALEDKSSEELSDLYSMELDSIKNALIEDYFKKDAKLEDNELAILNKQFSKALSDVVKEHNYYKRYVKNTDELLSEIRAGNKNKGFDSFFILIKEKMHNMTLCDKHKNQALQTMLDETTLQQWIHDKIIAYWEHIKSNLNPLKQEVERLKSEIEELKEEMREKSSSKVSDSELTLFSSKKKAVQKNIPKKKNKKSHLARGMNIFISQQDCEDQGSTDSLLNGRVMTKNGSS